MDSLEQSIISTLIFYDILKRPLTAVEIFKYLTTPVPDSVQGISFIELRKKLERLKIVNQKNGFYFLSQKRNIDIIRQRIKRQKIADRKWKKIKKITYLLQNIPFIQGVGVTGSLTLNNTRQKSDLDVLIIIKSGRIWTTRALITLFLTLIGQKRYGNKTKNKVCLNCYLTDDSLEIKSQNKPHNLYSAQEYARVIPLLEIENGLFKKFQKSNFWIKEYLAYYDFLNENNNLKTIKTIWIFSFIRAIGEFILNNKLGDYLEKIVGNLQKRKIIKGLHPKRQDDQIYLSNQCLMFHPHSKSLRFLEIFETQKNKLSSAVDKSS